MRTFVTGASGFLGTHVVHALHERGHEVVALCRTDVPTWLEAKATIRRGDVLNEASLRDAMAGCEAVLHCAGMVSRDPGDAEALHALHVGGTKNVVSAAKGVKAARVVVASSSGTIAISEDANHVATEQDETPIALISRFPYYRAKLFAERAALDASDARCAVMSVNPSLLLGPGDVHGSSTEEVRMFLERKIPAIPEGGLSYVDARDAALAMCLAMEQGAGGQRYLIGASNCTMRAFFERLERVSGVKAPWLPLPRAVTRFAGDALSRVARLGGAPIDATSLAMGQLYWYVDSSRAERELGWKARDPIATLADTVEDLRARGVVWPEAAISS